MKKLVILPGGFHPYHAGHKALYDAAVQAFPSADVYVAATADTSTRPFPFEVKQKLARLAGVPPHRFIQVKSPFSAKEITQMYDPDTTQLIFVRSEKDRDSQPKPGGIKKDGTPGYLQPYKRNGLQPMSKHGYMAYLPTVQFGPGMTSATEIRAKWPGMSPEQKGKLVNALYPVTKSNDKLTGVTVKMLDHVMGGISEALVGAPTGGALPSKSIPMPNGPDEVDEGVKGAILGGIAGAQLGGTPKTIARAAKIGSKLQDVAEPFLMGKEVGEGIKGEIAGGVAGASLGGLAGAAVGGPLGATIGSSIGGAAGAPIGRKLGDEVDEATLIIDPERGHQIRPDGGMGTWDEASLVSNLSNKFRDIVELLKAKNYSGIEHVLYRAGAMESMVRALAQYDRFLKQQGKKPVAKGRAVDMSKLGEDYVEEISPTGVTRP